MPRIKDGDFYINNSNQDFYLRENGVWVRKGNIRDEGSTGLVGVAPVLGMGFTLGAQVTRTRFLGSISHDIGFDLAAAVSRIRDIQSPLDFGVAITATIDRIRQCAAASNLGFSLDVAVDVISALTIEAAFDQGFTLSATLERVRELATDDLFGFSLAAAIDRIKALSASNAEGFSLAVTMQRIRLLTASPGLGFALSSTVTHTAAASTRLLAISNASPFVEVWDGDTQGTLKSSSPDVAYVAQNACKPTLSYDGRYMALSTGASSGTRLRIYDLSGATPTSIGLTGSGGAVTSLAFSPDGNWLAVTTATTPYVYLIYLPTSAIVTLASPPTSGCGQVIFNRQGTRLLVYNDAASTIKIYVFDQSSGISSFSANLQTGNGNAYSLEFDSAGAVLAVTDAASNGAKAWAVTSSGTVFTAATAIPGSTASTRDIAVSPDGAWIAVASATTPFLKVFSYPAMTLQTLSAIPSAPTFGVEFARDSASLLVSGFYSTLLKYDVATWTKATGVTRANSQGLQMKLRSI